MTLATRLHPLPHNPALWANPLPFDLYTDRGVLFSRMGSMLSDGHRQHLERQQLFRLADDAPASDSPIVDALFEQARQFGRIAGVWGCEAQDSGRVDHIAQQLLVLTREHSAVCLGMARYVPIQSHAVRHSFSVAVTALTLGLHLSLDDRVLITLARAALTMNVSSLALHDDCAATRGPLEAGLRHDIGGHPLLAAKLLSQTPGIDVRWIEAVEQHHENTDGSGYPFGNRRDAIPLEARILRVADVWCALVAPGPDRLGAAPRTILETLFENERRRLDDSVLFTLRRQFGPYPPGAFVRLANRETALVTAWSANGGMPQYVVSVFTPSGEVDPAPKVRLTRNARHAIRSHAPFTIHQLHKVPWGRVWAAAA